MSTALASTAARRHRTFLPLLRPVSIAEKLLQHPLFMKGLENAFDEGREVPSSLHKTFGHSRPFVRFLLFPPFQPSRFFNRPFPS